MISRRSLLYFSVTPLLSAATVTTTEETAWIVRLGGKFQRDAAGNVVAVNLGHTWVDNTEMLDLLAFKKLAQLNLEHTRISDEGLLRIRPARQIQDLNLLYAEAITDLGLNAIKEWTNLKRLNVRGTRTADDTLEIVGKLSQLESLDVANTGITDAGLESLAPLTKLKHLALGRARMGDSALSMLRLFNTLESLDLSGARDVQRNQRNNRGGATQDALWKVLADMKQLRVLKIAFSDVDADALGRMGPSLGKVEQLNLEGCQRVTDEAITQLASWKALKQLDVQETKVTPAAVENLKKLRPEMKVLWAPIPPVDPEPTVIHRKPVI